MKYFNQGVMSLCLVAGLISGGQALAQVTNTTPNGDSGMISTPAMKNDTALSTPTNGGQTNAGSTATTPAQGNTGYTGTTATTPTRTETRVDVNMPDINLPDTSADAGRDTVTRSTETTERTLIQTDNNDTDSGTNTIYLAIIGIVAVFLVAVIGMLASRKERPYQP
jgi:cobalamin biosynthesis Mg chelatase CobN